MIDNDWDADSLEYYITLNSNVTPSKHLLSLHPSPQWISNVSEMEAISSSVESIVIKREVGKNEKVFSLSNLPSLTTVEMGCLAFNKCHSIVFESMNDWMNDEWDLVRLQSIILGIEALNGEELIMKSKTNVNLIDEISLLWLHSKEMVTISGI